MTRHDLKTWPEFFDAVADGSKTFELRRDDRGFEVGDVLALHKYDPDTEAWLGSMLEVRVSYVMRSGALALGWCILGLATHAPGALPVVLSPWRDPT